MALQLAKIALGDKLEVQPMLAEQLSIGWAHSQDPLALPKLGRSRPSMPSPPVSCFRADLAVEPRLGDSSLHRACQRAERGEDASNGADLSISAAAVHIWGR